MTSTVAGVPVPTVTAPATLDELSFALASSAAQGQAVCVAGGATKLEIGAAPAKLDLLVSMAAMNQLIEYNPSDLVVRAQAGMRLADLQAVVAESGQRLALDPPEADATLGGVVAANASGPRRHRYGTVRDVLIGATFVLADGTVSHTGGKVVKNVAGYDLAKLLTGSYGTLAVLADVTFRLHGRPAAAIAVHTEVSSASDVARVVASYQGSYLEPSALELRSSLPSNRGVVMALFEGDDATAGEHASAAAAMLVGSRIQPWDETIGEHPWPSAGIGVRVAFPPASLEKVLATIAPMVEAATVRGRIGVGVLEVSIAEVTDLGEMLAYLREGTAPLGASVVVIAAPAPMKVGVDLWGPTPGLDLMRSIKDQFDPAHRLAPGRFVGGI